MTRKIKCKQHPGLTRSGKLRKGYRYSKGGRIVKAKKKTKKKKR